MRRRILEPPRAAAPDGLAHVSLEASHEARPVARPHFDPKAGWFRRIERATSLFLARRVFPILPGSTLPYAPMLATGLTVAEATIPVSGLPLPFDGTTILFVSDIHAGPFLSRGALAGALDRLATLRADLVIHGGDLATSNLSEIEIHAEALARLRAPLGVFAVLGNHDHYTRDLAGLEAFYERCGIRLLRNDAAAVSRGGSVVALAGIDDWNIGRPDLGRAMRVASEVAPGAPVILASHNPDALFEAARGGVALVLAGHTHGGQVRIPGRPVLVRMSRYRLDEGHFTAGATHLVVSRGLGVSGLPLRVYCPPEALAITLRRPAP